MSSVDSSRENTVVSHYKIIAAVGRGGMGVVYKAQDLDLNRIVALKFISRELSWDGDAATNTAHQRFLTEARAASALDHPNIGTIHTIDRAPDGQVFIVMSYYEGETLRDRLKRGKLSSDETAHVFGQIVHGLANAHAAGIVHRDIKPGNLLLTTDGLVKVIDFGLAKLGSGSNITATGATLGTVSYMSPEQINGDAADARADVWSLGAVLYEMLTGRPAFDGPTPPAIMHSVLATSPVDALTDADLVPAAWQRVMRRALDRDLSGRYATAGELEKDLVRLATLPPSEQRSLSRRLLSTVVVALILLTIAGWAWKRSSDRAWISGEAIPQLRRLVDDEKFPTAAALAARATRLAPGDTVLAALSARILAPASITTTPSGAEVFVREYSDTGAAWTRLGATPVTRVDLPRGLKRWRVILAGYDTLELARAPEALELPLTRSEPAHVGMVRIPAGRASAWIAGLDPIEGQDLAEYYIDRYEVTNREFKKFVDAGAYAKEDFWKVPVVKGGVKLDWRAAMSNFVDPTGRPGPSTWELGTYAKGQDDYPVSGISWYEAAAYAEFVGKSLPTVYHWVRAASTRIPQSILPLSNFGGAGKMRAGANQGMSEFGVYDMAGNVREWQYNASGSERHALGGAWNDPVYLFTFASTRDPLDRSPDIGFRCATYAAGVPADAGRNLDLSHRDYSKERPVADEVFRAYLNQFSYDQSPLDPRVETDSALADYRHEVVSFGAAYGGERVIAHLFIPKTGRPPYQTVIYYPGSGASTARRFNNEGPLWLAEGGRAVVFPIYKSTYERNDGLTSTWANPTHRHTEAVVRQVKDFKRTVDYLATRKEFDLTRLAYYGNSWGARMGTIIPAVDTRIKTAILAYGGLSSGHSLPEVDQINYAGHITVPVLMLNGRFDAIEPYETAQLPLFRVLGSPPDKKRHVVWDVAHGGAPVNAFRKEVLDWLDKTLGPPAR